MTLRHFLKFYIKDAAFLLCLFFLIINQYPNFADDPGVGWHLKSGKLILDKLSIPEFDPFLSSTQPRIWISDQWLSDVILYRFYSIGAWQLIYAVITVIFAITFFITLYRCLRNQSITASASLLAVLFAFKLAQVHFILRPVVFSFLLFTLLFSFLLSLNNKKRQLIADTRYLIPILFLIWCNAHPSFILGLGFFVLFIATTPFNKKNVICFAFCAVFTLINPYLFNLHKSIVALGCSDFFMNFNEEWKALSLQSFEGQFLCFGLALIALACVVKRCKHISLFEIISLLVFTYLTFHSIRFLPYLAIIISLPLAKSLQGLFANKSYWLGSKNAKIINDISIREESAPSGSVYLIAAFIFILSSAVFAMRIWPYQGNFGPSASIYPYEAMNKLNAIVANRVGLTVVSHPNWGGFITYMSKEQAGEILVKPVIDDRNTLLGEGFYKSYFTGMRPGPQFLETLKGYKANLVLLPKGSKLAEYILTLPEFHLIYSDPIADLFEFRCANCDNLQSFS